MDNKKQEQSIESLVADYWMAMKLAGCSGKTNKETVKLINDNLLIEQTELCKADLGFVFGAADDNARAHLIDKAADLYHNGYFRKLIVSGGVTSDGAPAEAYDMRDGLIRKGVPDEAILVEDAAMNTQQNVEKSKLVIDKEIGIDNVKSIIGIGQLFAARRYMQTVNKVWPEVLNMHVSVDSFAAGKENWTNHDEMRKKVLTEWYKQEVYVAVGLIEDIDLDEINNKVIQMRNQNAPGSNNKIDSSPKPKF
jgi:uncharacterized SAM-binding protein YcdF (DUF218 family)